MWTLEPSDDYDGRAKKFSKRHCHGFNAVHENLTTYKEALDAGALVQDIKYGFVHHEPDGVKAIDQKGARHAMAMRLYVYPDPMEQVLHLLTIGDKNTQHEDIRNCSAAVREIRKKAGKNG